MQWMLWAARIIVVAAAWAGGSGCASQARTARHRSGNDDARPAPFELVGEDTVIQLDLNRHEAAPADRTHEWLHDEVGYLNLGGATVECFLAGSVLLLGPDNGIVLVDQNPLWQLRPVGHDGNEAKLVRLYATLFLVCGSVDQLPTGLSDYLDDPGPRRRIALSLARQLLTSRGAELTGWTRGGAFVLTFRLTPSGRAKLTDVLQSAEDETEIQFVSRR
jgi:hypothetical protein